MTTSSPPSMAPPEPLPITSLPGGVAMITLEHPQKPLVILDQALLQRLDRTLDELEDGLKAVYVRSADERVFVAGADLKEIDSLDDDQLHHYLVEGTRIFGRLAQLPCPTVALVNGAALGGGLELALHCSAIIATRVNAKGKPYPVGLPEAGLGLCPAWGGTQRLPGRVTPGKAVPAAATGKPYSIDDVPEGLVDAFADSADSLISTADAWLSGQDANCAPGTIQSTDHDVMQQALAEVRSCHNDNAAAMAVCEAMQVGLERGLEAGLEAERRLLLALRQTEDTRSKLDAFFKGAR